MMVNEGAGRCARYLRSVHLSKGLAVEQCSLALDFACVACSKHVLARPGTASHRSLPSAPTLAQQQVLPLGRQLRGHRLLQAAQHEGTQHLLELSK